MLGESTSGELAAVRKLAAMSTKLFRVATMMNNHLMPMWHLARREDLDRGWIRLKSEFSGGAAQPSKSRGVAHAVLAASGRDRWGGFPTGRFN
jgi:hypothetical protein